MTDICSNIDEAIAIAKRLAKRNKDVASAMSNRDICLYKLFESVHEIHRQLLKMGKQKANGVLTGKYGNAKPKNLSDFLKRICPELPSKRRSKYLGLLSYAQATKEPDQPLREFVRANGGINGCVKKEKELRDPKKSRDGIGKGLKAHKLTKRKNRASMRSTV
jgi:hypothetical protein